MKKVNSTSDPELWHALQKGDQAALGCIFDKYVYVLYSYGAQITKDYALIEDCIQDVFVELWQRHAALTDTTSIKFYLFKSLRRRILRKLNQQRSFAVTNTPPEEMVFSYETQLIQQQSSEENQQKLLHVLNTLSEKQKKVLFLKYYDKLSYEEIAKIMSMDIKAVYDLVYHSIKILKKHFQKAVLTLLYFLASFLFPLL